MAHQRIPHIGRTPGEGSVRWLCEIGMSEIEGGYLTFLSTL